MAATFVSAGTGVNASGATVTINAPSSIVSGNLLIMAVAGSATTSGFTASGWTLRSSLLSGPSYFLALFTKTATGSEPSTYSATATGSGFTTGVVAQYSGATDIEALTSNSNAAASVTSFTLASITPAGTGRTWLGFLTTSGTASPSTPSGFAAQVSYKPASALTLFLFDQSWPTSGATGTASAALGASASYASLDVLAVPVPAVTGTAAVSLGPLTVGVPSTSATGCARVAWLDLDGDTLMLENKTAGYFCTSLDVGFPAVREVVSNRPDRDGITDRSQYMGSRVVSANITALAGAGAIVDQVAALFAPYMLPAARPVLHYVLDRPGHPERTLTLRAAGYSWPVAGPYQRDIQLQWVAADPVAYDPTPRTAAATTATPATITSPGDVPVRPLIRVTGPITAPAVTLTPAGGPAWVLAFISTFAVAAGHFIEIDTDARTVYLDGDPAKPRLSSLDWTQSSWQWLPPAPSTATMTLAGSGTSGATQATAAWQDGYLT